MVDDVLVIAKALATTEKKAYIRNNSLELYAATILRVFKGRWSKGNDNDVVTCTLGPG